MSLTAQVTCACGYGIRVAQTDGGQSLFGTLGDQMARHDARCECDRWQYLWDNTVMV